MSVFHCEICGRPLPSPMGSTKHTCSKTALSKIDREDRKENFALTPVIPAAVTVRHKFRIIGDHPHAGRIGTVLVTDGKVIVHTIGGAQMYKIDFDENDEHGTDGCFARIENLKRVK